MNVLLWHVHGSWTTAFVQGDHRDLVHVTRTNAWFWRQRLGPNLWGWR